MTCTHTCQACVVTLYATYWLVSQQQALRDDCKHFIRYELLPLFVCWHLLRLHGIVLESQLLQFGWASRVLIREIHRQLGTISILSVKKLLVKVFKNLIS